MLSKPPLYINNILFIIVSKWPRFRKRKWPFWPWPLWPVFCVYFPGKLKRQLAVAALQRCSSLKAFQHPKITSIFIYIYINIELNFDFRIICFWTATLQRATRWCVFQNVLLCWYSVCYNVVLIRICYIIHTELVDIPYWKGGHFYWKGGHFYWKSWPFPLFEAKNPWR